MNNKIKRILVAMQVFLVGIGTKTFAGNLSWDSIVAGASQFLYGVQRPKNIVKEEPKLLSIILPIIYILIGICIIFNKKITKKQKIITLTVLTAIVILILAIYKIVVKA